MRMFWMRLFVRYTCWRMGRAKLWMNIKSVNKAYIGEVMI